MTDRIISTQRSIKIFFVLVVMILSGCAVPTATPAIPTDRPKATSATLIAKPPLPTQTGVTRGIVRLVEHPQPSLVAFNFQPFIDAGCKVENKLLTCPVNQAPFAEFGCAQLRETNWLGGLNPALPLLECTVRVGGQRELPKEDYIRRGGCMLPSYSRFIIWRENHFQVLKNEVELRAVFAPIESPAEALSYAVALTGNTAYFDLKIEPKMRYLVEEVHQSFVTETPAGYQVLLYFYQFCGCGPHAHSAVTLQVSRSGEIVELSRIKVFEDPTQDGLCVD